MAFFVDNLWQFLEPWGLFLARNVFCPIIPWMENPTSLSAKTLNLLEETSTYLVREQQLWPESILC